VIENECDANFSPSTPQIGQVLERENNKILKDTKYKSLGDPLAFKIFTKELQVTEN
jgi:hypothetical protein